MAVSVHLQHHQQHDCKASALSSSPLCIFLEQQREGPKEQFLSEAADCDKVVMPEFSASEDSWGGMDSSCAVEVQKLESKPAGENQEACDDAKESRKSEGGESCCYESDGERRQVAEEEWESRRRFPPPIPYMERALRWYKRDGRLVIHEVRATHHEFFRAQRCNGRLTLHLFTHDADTDSSDNDEEDDGTEEEEEDVEEEHVKEAEHQEEAKEITASSPPTQLSFSVPISILKAPSSSSLGLVESPVACCSPSPGFAIATVRAVTSS